MVGQTKWESKVTSPEAGVRFDLHTLGLSGRKVGRERSLLNLG